MDNTENFYSTIIDFLNILRRKNMRDAETSQNYRQLASSIKSIIDRLTSKLNADIIKDELDIADIRFQIQVETLKYVSSYLDTTCDELINRQAIRKNLSNEELLKQIKEKEQQNYDQRHGKLTTNN